MLAMDEGDVPAAEHWFRQAILIKEDFRAALFNLALLLADDHRPLQAAPFLNQLVRFHPDHVKALILLGDIYINNIKDLDAAENVSVHRWTAPTSSLTFSNFFCHLCSVTRGYCN
jgi:protein O-mannosyl-transferase